MDEFKVSPDDRSEFTLEDLERLQKINAVLCEHAARASQTFEKLYLFLKSVYEPSNNN